MKLLFITQKLDKEDSVLGFTHQWVEKIAQKIDSVKVICLEKGVYHLPSNVDVFSLQKEQGRSRKKYIVNFYKHIWQLRNDYHIVFCHMNAQYVVLAGILWKLLGKKVFLWRNHRKGTLIARLAVWLSNTVFYTSLYSFTARFKKAKQMPVGVDSVLFKKQEQADKQANSILCLGRIAPVKNVVLLIKAAQMLDRQGIDFNLSIVGAPGEKDKDYFNKIKEMAKDLEQRDKIRFLGKMPNYKAPEIYNQNEIFVNLTKAGSFDKTIIEAMACGLITFVCNQSLKNVLPQQFIFESDNPEDLKNKLASALKMSLEEKQALGRRLSQYASQNHSLDILINKLINEFIA